MISNRTSVVSDAPLVSIRYFLDDAGSMTKLTCLPAVRSRTAGLFACSRSGDFFSGGYHLRTHFLSAAESVPGGDRPSAWYRFGSAMRPGSKSYSMIETKLMACLRPKRYQADGLSAWYRFGSAMRPGSKSYSMIESGSH